MSAITGGEPVKKTVVLSDADMENIKAFEGAGVGTRGYDADAAWHAILGERQRNAASPGNRYRNWSRKIHSAISDPRGTKAWQAQNASFDRRVRNSLSSSDVHSDSFLAQISTQYGNDEFIGEMLAPPVLVGKKSDEFPTYGKRDRLALPANDSVAVGGEAARVHETRGTDSYVCANRAFTDALDADTVANQDAPLNEMFDLVEGLVERRALAREIRIASALTTAGNYPSGNKATLAGADQWNSAGGGAPLKNIQDAIAALWRGRSPARTKAFSSLEIYNVLSRHPDITGLFQYSGQSVGLATPGMISTFLGLDDYLIGKSRYDSDAVNIATPTYSRVWGDFFGVLRVAERATLRSATFALTMRWLAAGVPGMNQGILTSQWFEPNKGFGGSYWAKVGESEAHKIQASDAGYLYSDVLA
jgi:hypothetical protein